MAVAQQAFDNLTGMLTDQWAGKVIDCRGLREFKRRILHLPDPQCRVLHLQYICRWRSCGSCSTRSSALCTGRARTQRPDSVPSTRTYPASYSMLQCPRPSPPGARGRPASVANFGAVAQRGMAHHLHQALPLHVRMAEQSHTNRYNRQHGCDRYCGARPSVHGNCSREACRASGRDCRGESRRGATPARSQCSPGAPDR